MFSWTILYEKLEACLGSDKSKDYWQNEVNRDADNCQSLGRFSNMSHVLYVYNGHIK